MKKNEKIREHKEKINNLIVTQFKKPKRHDLHFKRVKIEVIDALRKKEYDKLRNWVSEYFPSNVDRDHFFSQEGHHILKYILAYSEDLNVFKLVTDLFSIKSIRMALQNNNCNAIREFFIVQHGEELFNDDNQLNRMLRVEKFKILLQMAEEIIKKFIKDNYSSSYMTIKIKQDFDKAIIGKNEFKSIRYCRNIT